MDANRRLTALTGLVLLPIFVVEIVTVVLQPRRVLTLHVFVGMVLIPVVVLKLISTGARIVGYYRGVPNYRREGPPTPLLRVLSPILSVLTIAFLATGVVLIAGPHAAYGSALVVHKKIFFPWLAALIVHLAAHLAHAARSSYRDLGRSRMAATPRARNRIALLTGCLLVGVATGMVFAGQASSYLHHHASH